MKIIILCTAFTVAIESIDLRFKDCFTVVGVGFYDSSVTRKNRQMSIKVALNDSSRTMIDFDTFTKIA